MPGRARQRTGADAAAARLFGLSLLVAGGGLIAIALAVAGGAGAVQTVPVRAAPRFTVLHQSFSYPSANVAAVLALGLAALGLFVLLRLTAAALTEAAGRRRFARAVAARHPRPYRGAIVVDDTAPQAFCAGLLRPRVYLSTAAVRGLRPDELDAVLAHERHHRRRRDPLRIAMSRAVADALFFLRVLRRLSDRYSAVAELAADDAAVGSVRGGASTLASALLSFSASAPPRGAVGIAPERVDHLLGRAPSLRLPSALLVGGAGTVLLLAAAAWRLGRVAVVHASLKLPLLSARPCVMVLALGCGGLGALALAYRRRPAR
ncbi:MAG TPA: M56 family metallopeptidase [Solirubrobacteraceae bacterium]|nr:M56 family metallopeptidase [Solirubrobacteraceae bacterium]